MQTPHRYHADVVQKSSGPVTVDALIDAFVSRIPAEHQAAVRERLMRSDRRISAQSSDAEGQAILDRLYQLRGR